MLIEDGHNLEWFLPFLASRLFLKVLLLPADLWLRPNYERQTKENAILPSIWCFLTSELKPAWKWQNLFLLDFLPKPHLSLCQLRLTVGDLVYTYYDTNRHHKYGCQHHRKLAQPSCKCWLFAVFLMDWCILLVSSPWQYHSFEKKEGIVWPKYDIDGVSFMNKVPILGILFSIHILLKVH